MSVEAITIALHHSRAKGSDKLVLLGIANHHGDNGAYPSLETLGRYSGVSQRSVRRSIQELQKLGEIVVYVNGAPTSGQYKPNLYYFTLACPPDCDRSMNHKVRGDKFVTQGGQWRHSGGTQMSAKPVIEPKEQPSIPQASLEDLFSEFWQAYPRKVEKLAAKNAFAKAIKLVDPQIIIDGAHRYANDPNLPEKQFIPHPGTWLNAGRWEDEPCPERVLSPEERKKLEDEERYRRKEIERQQLREEQERRRQEEQELKAKAQNVRLCDHGRVAAICPICNLLHKRDK